MDERLLLLLLLLLVASVVAVAVAPLARQNRKLRSVTVQPANTKVPFMDLCRTEAI